MVMILEGKNKIRDLIDADIDNGQLGTGTTAETEADTGLETAVGATEIAVTTTTASKQLQIDYNLSSTIGNGSTYSEYEFQSTEAAVSYNRITFFGIAKTSSEEFQISTILDIE
jgi:hypothetical protein